MEASLDKLNKHLDPLSNNNWASMENQSKYIKNLRILS